MIVEFFVFLLFWLFGSAPFFEWFLVSTVLKIMSYPKINYNFNGFTEVVTIVPQ